MSLNYLINLFILKSENMYWKTKDEYNIIWDVSLEKLNDFCNENNIAIRLFDKPTRWTVFSIYYGIQNGLTKQEAFSFGRTISKFIGECEVYTGTEYDYDEEKIDHTIYWMYNSITNINTTELKKKRAFFSKVFELYKNNIEKYELKHKTISIDLGSRAYQQFMNIDGETNKDKLLTLLR